MMNLPEIRYNYVIAGNGLIFSGRGWDYVSDGSDSTTEYISFGFIGNFTEKSPDPKSVKTFYSFLEQGIKLEKVDENYEIIDELGLLLN
jgi:N-acetylmuramoyl-L-alanine amidase